MRWTPSLARLLALSVRQPWGWLIVNGVKDMENRSWCTHHRGPLLIHASLSAGGYTEDIEWVERNHGISVPRELETGGIVGVVDVRTEELSGLWIEIFGYSAEQKAFFQRALLAPRFNCK
jgi:hypothetical protein